MADGHRETGMGGDHLDLPQALAHGRGQGLVVEEDVAAGMGHAKALGHPGDDGFLRRPGIEEHQPLGAELAHHRRHALGIAGEFAAHMVADADIAVETAERPAQPAQNVLGLEVANKRVRPRILVHRFGLHRDMHQKFVTGGARGLCLAP